MADNTKTRELKDKSDIEILKDFAKETGRTIEFNELQYPLSTFRQIPRFRRTIYIPNNSIESSYFVWFSDPYKKIGEHTVFFGTFIPITFPKKVKVIIRKKNFLDILNLNSQKNNIKSGIDSFDSDVVIKGDDSEHLKRLLSKNGIQSEILNTFRKKDFLKISINEFDLGFIPIMIQTRLKMSLKKTYLQ